MIQKVRNRLEITAEVNFATATNIEIYLSQGELFRTYTPDTTADKKMTVFIPKADADTLNCRRPVEIQFALTDEKGEAVISEIVTESVERLLKESGYGN